MDIKGGANCKKITGQGLACLLAFPEIGNAAGYNDMSHFAVQAELAFNSNVVRLELARRLHLSYVLKALNLQLNVWIFRSIQPVSAAQVFVSKRYAGINTGNRNNQMAVPTG